MISGYLYILVELMAVSNWKPCVCLRMRVLGAAARAVDECTLHCTHWSAFLPRLSYRTHSHVRNVYSRKLINVHMPLFLANKALAVHLQCSTARVGLCNQSIRSQVWHCARSQNAVEIISANKMNAKLIVCVACKNAESAEVLNAAIALLFMFAERQRILLSFFIWPLRLRREQNVVRDHCWFREARNEI